MNPQQGTTMNLLRSLQQTPQEPLLYFTTLENSILVQKMDISKTAWINPCNDNVL